MLLSMTTEAIETPTIGKRKRAVLVAAKLLKDGSCWSRVYRVRQDYTDLLVTANHEQHALDAVVNANMFDLWQMDADTFAEYTANGWDDSFLTAGNAGEPFWCENLRIDRVL